MGPSRRGPWGSVNNWLGPDKNLIKKTCSCLFFIRLCLPTFSAFYKPPCAHHGWMPRNPANEVSAFDAEDEDSRVVQVIMSVPWLEGVHGLEGTSLHIITLV